MKPTEAVDDEGDEPVDGGGADADAGQQLAVLLDVAVVVEDGANVDRRRRQLQAAGVQQVPRTRRHAVCKRPRQIRIVRSSDVGRSDLAGGRLGA